MPGFDSPKLFQPLSSSEKSVSLLSKSEVIDGCLRGFEVYLRDGLKSGYAHLSCSGEKLVEENCRDEGDKEIW